MLCKDICQKLLTYDQKKIIEEWRKNALFDIQVSKRDDESGKLYKPVDINMDGKLKVIDDNGKEDILDPKFPFIPKI